jgi:single-strand DNA-binding protein
MATATKETEPNTQKALTGADADKAYEEAVDRTLESLDKEGMLSAAHAVGTTTATVQAEKPERNTQKMGETTKVGNLTRDPELHFAPTGTAVVRTGLAVERPKVAGNWAGERVTTFYELVVFGTLGEHVAESLGKGTRVVVTGNAEVENWTDDKAQARTTKRILANAIGPDLRWVTVTVTKVTRKGAPVDEAPSGTDDEDEAF